MKNLKPKLQHPEKQQSPEACGLEFVWFSADFGRVKGERYCPASQMVVWPALTPALAPEEREQHFSIGWLLNDRRANSVAGFRLRRRMILLLPGGDLSDLGSCERNWAKPNALSAERAGARESTPG